MKNTAKIFLILLFTSSSLTAQVYFDTRDQSNYKIITSGIVLSTDEQDFADDLSYILEQLEKNSRDYIKYFTPYQNPYAKKLQSKLITVLIGLKSDRYCIDIITLEDDINQLLELADAAEAKLKENSEERALYRNVRTLKSDMNLLITMINQDLKSLEPDKEEINNIRTYLKQQRYADPKVINYNQALIRFSDKVKEEFEKEKALQEEMENSNGIHLELKEAMALAEELSKLYALELEDLVLPKLESLVVLEKLDSVLSKQNYFHTHKIKVPVAPEPPEPLILPSVPDIRVPNLLYFDGLRKELSDSVFVTSSKTPIVVKNKIGDIEIIGWDKSMVKAVFRISLMAESNEAAEEFADQVKLKFISDNNVVLVKAEIPTLRNPERKILNSQLSVFVPNENKISCFTSFGKTYIKKLDWINLDGSNTEVILTDISENIRTSLTKSSIQIEDCQGELSVKNSGGNIFIKNCESNIFVENSYAPISVKDCSGKLNIRNNNNIRVSNQSGPTEIDNKNGIVQVDDLTGGIKVRNAFKPMILTNISGGADLTNQNSTIKLDNVKGKIVAVNHAGEIIGENISGPIDIQNESGQTTLSLNRYFAGPSSIVSNYSLINLSLKENSNILLSTPNKGVKLLGNVFNSVQPTGSSTLIKQFMIGTGDQTLDILGTNNTVVVYQEENDLN